MTIEVTGQPLEETMPPLMSSEAETEAAESEAEVDSGKPQAAPPLPKGTKLAKQNTESLAERQARSTVWRAVKEGQDKALKDLILSFGSDAAFQVVIERIEPDTVFDSIAGRSWTTAGWCGKFENKAIDEELIQTKWGGGTYQLKFKDRKPGGSGWQFAGQLQIKIPGDPNLAEYRMKAGITASGQPSNGTPPAGENVSVVKEAMGMVKEQLARAEERQNKPDGSAPLLDLMREQLNRAREEAAELRAEMRELANRPQPKPAEQDPLQKKLFESLLDGDTARMTQLRMLHESEIRQLKETHLEDIKRREDRNDRDYKSLQASHDREIAAMKASHELAMATTKTSHEVALASAVASHLAQKSVLESENKRLTSDNADLKAEVKELRAVKNKSPLEILKDAETIKNAVGAGDEDDGSTASKIVEAITSPATWDGIAGVISKAKGTDPNAAAAQQAQIAAQQQAQLGGRRVVKHTDGKKYILEPDGTLKGPIEKKKKAAAAPGETPAEPVMPEIDEGTLKMTIGLLEAAYQGRQDPEIVAQSNRSRVPEEIMGAIRDHGVDAVMTKMAKLPSTSPLMQQAGRNWMRKLGKALVGE